MVELIAASVAVVTLGISVITLVSRLVRLAMRMADLGTNGGYDPDEVRGEVRAELARGKDAIRKYLERNVPPTPAEPPQNRAETPIDPKAQELRFSRTYRRTRGEP